jgi:hypothetical protein
MAEMPPMKVRVELSFDGASVAMAKVLGDIGEERVRQDERWGAQNHPDGTGPGLLMPVGGITADLYREAMRDRCDLMHQVAAGTWEHILTEEYAEAMAEDDVARLRKELIQLAAVAVAWVEHIDRRTA